MALELQRAPGTEPLRLRLRRRRLRLPPLPRLLFEALGLRRRLLRRLECAAQQSDSGSTGLDVDSCTMRVRVERVRVERFSHTRQSHTSLMNFKCVTSRQMNSIGIQ